MQEENSVSPVELNTNDTINQIFDKIIKYIFFNLSKTSVISLINGMFSENFPLDSDITYNQTENIDKNLKKSMADIIITIHTNGQKRRFHIEGQINDDSTIVIRVFEYGFQDALRHQTEDGNKIKLPFPKPVIIFLEHTATTPDELVLELVFSEQEKFSFKVPTIKFLSYSVDDLHKKNMTILLPLYLLKIRREVENALKRENNWKPALKRCADKLKKLIDKEILPAIAESEKAGTVSHNDAFELLRLLDCLYRHLYGKVKLFKNEEVDSMLADTLDLKYTAELAEFAAGAAKARNALKLKYDAELAEAEAKTEIRLLERHKEGRKEERMDIARSMKEYGDSIEKIAQITGFSIEKIEKL